MNYKINFIDLSQKYKSDEKIDILLPVSNEKKILELVIKIPYQNFLKSNYKNYININNDANFINNDANFINIKYLQNKDTDSRLLKIDYFLNYTIKEFFNIEKTNLDPNTNYVILKLSIQAEMDNYINIGLISIMKD